MAEEFAETAEQRAERLGIEWGAARHQAYSDMPASEGEIDLSLAISAKRIADALEKANEPINILSTGEYMAHDPMVRIAVSLARIVAVFEQVGPVSNMAYEAGRAFEAGRRHA